MSGPADLFDTAALRQITAWLEAAGLQAIEIDSGQRRLRLSLAPRAARQGGAVVADAAGTAITAPLAGEFLTRHPAREAPFVQPGDAVKAGDVLGLVRVGPVFTPVTAPQDGVVLDLLAAPGAVVGYGAPLFSLLPATA